MKSWTLEVATLFTLALPGAANSDVPRSGWTHSEPPGIRVWTSHGEVYQRGERVRVYFRTERDAYVTILRVDTDGRLRVLFPRQPWEDNLVRGGRSYDVRNYNRRDAFVVDDDPGLGYVFGIASDDPFMYEAFVNSDHWDFQLVGDGRIHGDPYVSLDEIVRRMVPEGYTDWDTHLLPYHVERHYDYPRFVCYDCHSYTSYSYWNPYRWYCNRFSLFIYSDPYYYYPSYWYPPTYYGGTRVVYVQGQRPGRYVFKPRNEQTQPGITYRDRRNEPVDARRPADRGVRGADIGGVGSVAVPGRRAAPPLGSGGGHTPSMSQPQRLPLTGSFSTGRRTAPAQGRTEEASAAATGAKEPRADAASGRRAVSESPYEGREARPADRAPEATREEPQSEPRAVARPSSREPSPEPRAAPPREPRGGSDRGSASPSRPEPRGGAAPSRPSQPSGGSSNRGGLVRRRP